VDREDVREDRRRREQQTQEPSPPVSSGQVLEHPTTTGTQHTPAGPTTRAVSRSEMRANSHGRVRPHRISSRMTHIGASRRARPAVHVSHEGCTENGAIVGRLRPEMLGNRKRIAVFTAVPRKQGTLHGRQGTRPLRSWARPCSPSWPDDSTADRRDSLPYTLTCVPMALGGGPDASRAAERRSQPLGSATYRPGHPTGTGPCSTRVRISKGIRHPLQRPVDPRRSAPAGRVGLASLPAMLVSPESWNLPARPPRHGVGDGQDSVRGAGGATRRRRTVTANPSHHSSTTELA
jgi:hypothetical protein